MVKIAIKDVIFYLPDAHRFEKPMELDIVRQIPGPDRPDYWVGKLTEPFHVIWQDEEKTLDYLIVTAHWPGTVIDSGMKNVKVGIACVTDISVLKDKTLQLAKCKYLGAGIASEKEG